MIIRKANKKDFKQFFELKKEWAKIYQKVSRYKIETPSEKKCLLEFKDLFKKNMLLYVAEEKGKLAGFFIGILFKNKYRDDVGYINDIFVSEDYQGKGISSLFKKEFFKVLKKNKIKRCKLDVNPENKKAIKIYKKWGFVIDKYGMSVKV